MNVKNILIVDDDKILSQMFSELLSEFDFNTKIANSGNKAFELLESQVFTPDLIISDVKMPDGDGNYLLAKLKSNYPQIPIIMVTGFTDGTMQDLIEKGALAILNKPFPIDDLLDIINNLK